MVSSMIIYEIHDFISAFFWVSGTLKSELHAIISACRKTRLFVDHACLSLANLTLTITEVGVFFTSACILILQFNINF